MERRQNIIVTCWKDTQLVWSYLKLEYDCCAGLEQIYNYWVVIIPNKKADLSHQK